MAFHYTYPSSYVYLLYTPSRYTGEDLLNYKSLDCYINFVSGWVREVLVKTFDEKRVVLGKVRHAVANYTIYFNTGLFF